MVNQEKWFNSLQDGRSIMFAAIAKGTGEFIGVCGLCYIDHHNRSAEVSWYIGDGHFAEKGYDKEIISLLLRYGFDEIGLHRIFAECYEFAEDRLEQLKKRGFEEEGVLRDVVFRHGKFWNSVMLSILVDNSGNKR